MKWLAKRFGKVVIEIGVDRTTRVYMRWMDKDYEVAFSINYLTDYNM